MLRSFKYILFFSFLFLLTNIQPSYADEKNLSTSKTANPSDEISLKSFERIFSRNTTDSSILLSTFISEELISLTSNANHYKINRFFDVTLSKYQDEAKALLLFTYMKRSFNFFWDFSDAENHYLLPQFVDIENSPSENEEIVTLNGLSSPSEMGFACVAYIIGAEYGWITSKDLLTRLQSIISFFADLSNANIKKGFFSSLYNIQSGQKAKYYNFSSLDTSYFLIGAIAAKQYLSSQKLLIQKKPSSDSPALDIIDDIIKKIDFIYNRINWTALISVDGFLSQGWDYNGNRLYEKNSKDTLVHKDFKSSYLLYLLAIGSTNNQISPNIWAKLNRDVKDLYTTKSQEESLLGAHFSLIQHIFPQCYLDLRDYKYKSRETNFAREKIVPFKDSSNWQYFENTSKVIQFNRQYVRNLAQNMPNRYPTYLSYWGLSECWSSKYSYDSLHPLNNEFPMGARVSPTIAMASINFNEVAVFNQYQRLLNRENFPVDGFPEVLTNYGFVSSFTFSTPIDNRERVMPRISGKEKGSEILALENFFTGLVWQLISMDKNVTTALKNVGFPFLYLPGSSPSMGHNRHKSLAKPVITKEFSIISETDNTEDPNGIELFVHNYHLFPSVDFCEYQLSNSPDFKETLISQVVTQENFFKIYIALPGDTSYTHLRVRLGQFSNSENENLTYTAWSELLNTNDLLNSEPSIININEENLVISPFNYDTNTNEDKDLTITLNPEKDETDENNNTTSLESDSRFDKELKYMQRILSELQNNNANPRYIKRATHYISLLEKYQRVLNTPLKDLPLLEKYQKITIEKKGYTPLSFLRRNFPYHLKKLEKITNLKTT
ncbi:hypothetical protein AB834_03215 [PVC group bacterium (ex Bugula neritina AB1)]|nr:hypothetical protein AB834_03215 [PVC group bacterium (ex Bugula neritina AB1)]